MKLERMSNFVDRGNKLIADGKTPEAMKLIERGLGHYTKKIINALTPYAKTDAGLIVFVLRYIADEIEKNNPGAKELASGMEKCVIKPDLRETEKIKRAIRK